MVLDINKKAREEKIRFMQNFLNLYFRRAFIEYQEYMRNDEKGVNENPFSIEITNFKKRFDGITKIEQYYWDVLYEVNMRGKKIEDILTETSTKDPDKEAWIRKEIEDPTGAFKDKQKYWWVK